MKIKIITVLTLLFLALVFPAILNAQKMGVGVTTGSIRVDKPLKPGGVYNLPPIGVVNTGEIASDYKVTIAFDAKQQEIRPDSEWISFLPAQFYLEPGKSQAVNPVLALPINAVPGDYFAYLEASPVAKDEGPGTKIGIAAATRLYFTVAPANIFQGLYYRFISLYSQYHPWNTIVLAIILAAALIILFRKKFKIQIAKK